ncbi:MAG: DUF433 domain-containing protein [Nocardioidaceae bacterium]|nr:DUF433 domain-containing protein [Nocardioidaceae bacterium]
MSESLLDRAIYAYADVDRLVGLRAGTARRWLDGYTRGGVFYPPVLRPEPAGQDVVTWGEMVEARLLSEFRERDVPVQRMRPAIVKLRSEFGSYPLARARPWLDVDGRELVRVVQDEVGLASPMLLVVVRNDQLMLSRSAQRFYDTVEYADDIARRLHPEVRTRGVVMDPEFAFGQPAVRSVRTDVLAEDYRAGTSRDDMADLYELTAEQVDEALRFEMIAGRDRAA